MKFDLSQFAELDRTELLEITGGYYGTQNIHVEDSYVYANASQSYRDSVNNGTQSPGSTYGYVSSGGRVVAASSPVTPVGYLVPTSGGGHYYTDGQGYLIGADGKRVVDSGGGPLLFNSDAWNKYADNSKRVLQNSDLLPKALKDFGCAMLSTLYAVEEEIKQKTGKEFHFSAIQINSIFEQAIKDNVVNDYGAVSGGYAPLANEALKQAGYGNISCSTTEPSGQATTFSILMGSSMYVDSAGNPYTHFQLGDGQGNFLTDSVGKDTIPGSTSLRTNLYFY